MYDVTAVGELLIDFTPAGLSGQNHALYEQNPGGAPANVLACLTNLGRPTAFIGKVGNDQFGRFLKQTLDQAGINTQGLILTDACHTTLAFVHLNNQGDRSFSFYRNPGADLLLEADEVDTNLIRASRIFHYGSVSLSDEPSRSATLAAARQAREAGCLISFDPNLRLMLWSSDELARSVVLAAIPGTDVLKLSDDELLFLTGESDPSRGASLLIEKYQLKLVLITMGPRGAFASNGHVQAASLAYDVQTVDTTGAGDAFAGAFLDQILEHDLKLDQLNQSDLERMLAFANAAGSLATTRKGAIPAMPTREAILACLAHTSLLRVQG